MAARIARGQGEAVPGLSALLAILPDVRLLSWEDVNAARKLPGLPRLRSVLSEVERDAVSGVNFDEAALRAFIGSTAALLRRQRRAGAGPARTS